MSFKTEEFPTDNEGTRKCEIRSDVGRALYAGRDALTAARNYLSARHKNHTDLDIYSELRVLCDDLDALRDKWEEQEG